MEVGNGEAEAGGWLETARRCVHPDRGRREGVVGWEQEGTPVLTIFIRSFGWASEDVVPSGRRVNALGYLWKMERRC